MDADGSSLLVLVQQDEQLKVGERGRGDHANTLENARR